MRRLVEWRLEIALQPCGLSSLTHDGAVALLDRITRWAEDHRYGVGGGYNHETFAFTLGVCVTRDNDLVSEDEMHELELLIHREASLLDYSAVVTFREFTEEESDPDEVERIIQRTLTMLN